MLFSLNLVSIIGDAQHTVEDPPESTSFIQVRKVSVRLEPLGQAYAVLFIIGIDEKNDLKGLFI